MSALSQRSYDEIRNTLLARHELALLDVREEAPHAERHPLFAANLPLSKLELEVHTRLPRLNVPNPRHDACCPSATPRWLC